MADLERGPRSFRVGPDRAHAGMSQIRGVLLQDNPSFRTW